MNPMIGYFCYFLSGPQLPLQLQSVTVTQPVPTYTAVDRSMVVTFFDIRAENSQMH